MRTGHGAFIRVNTPARPQLDRGIEFKQDWDFDYTGDELIVSQLGRRWVRRIESVRAPFGHALHFAFRHAVSLHGANEDAENPPAPTFFGLRDITVSRPAGGAILIVSEVVEVKHPRIAGHVDIVRFTVTRPLAGNAQIHTAGRHAEKGKMSANWSFEPFERGVLSVEAGFAEGPDRAVLGPTAVDPLLDPHLEGTLALPGETRRPLEYTVAFDPLDAGGATSMAVSFPGEVDGVAGLVDLAAALDLYAFSLNLDDIVAPLLVDADSDDPSDLFVSLDLGQWLSDPVSYVRGQVFPIIGGINEDLQGYSFSRSSETFDPFDGFVRVAGNVDASVTVIPEPASALLAGVGALCLLAMHRRRRGRKHA